MAEKNKPLADKNKTRTGDKATHRSSHTFLHTGRPRVCRSEAASAAKCMAAHHCRRGTTMLMECPVPKVDENSLRAPVCVQCRGPMTVVQGEPDFKKPAFMVVTYQCAECGLRDRGCSIRHGNSTSFYDGSGRYIGHIVDDPTQ